MPGFFLGLVPFGLKFSVKSGRVGAQIFAECELVEKVP